MRSYVEKSWARAATPPSVWQAPQRASMMAWTRSLKLGGGAGQLFGRSFGQLPEASSVASASVSLAASSSPPPPPPLLEAGQPTRIAHAAASTPATIIHA